MVVEPHDKKRSRKWLQEHLWSDRASEQAQGSLRTTLAEIRRAFGDVEFLLSDRGNIWIKPTLHVTTDLSIPNSTREFLEGLNIEDPAFMAWLKEMRARYGLPSIGSPIETPRISRILLHSGAAENSSSKHNAQIIGDQIGTMISDFIAGSSKTNNPDHADLIIECSVNEGVDGSSIYAKVIDTKTDELIHFAHTTCTNIFTWLNTPGEMAKFCWDIADVAMDETYSQNKDRNEVARRLSYSQEAMSHVLSFDSDRMHKGLLLLERASSELKSGLFLALKAWSITSMIIEDAIPETKEVHEQVIELLHLAAELSPHDPMIMSLSASAYLALSKNQAEAGRMATKVLKRSPNNLIALQASSASLAAIGRNDLAYQQSNRAKAIAQSTKFEARCHLHHALLCLKLGKIDEASASAKSASANTNYRAPRRQLLALSALSKNYLECTHLVNELIEIEKDFRLDKFIFDEEYHTHTLRQTGILEKSSPFLNEIITAARLRPNIPRS